MLKRQITEEDLKDKGYPFECLNCGNKPTPGDVIENGGQCDICGDSIVAYTIDTAEYIIGIMNKKTKDYIDTGIYYSYRE